MTKRGRLSEIIYRNEENFYTVAVFENDDEMEQFTAVGSLPDAAEGVSYELTGEWKSHPRYGEQFSVRECRELPPDGKDAIIAFLSSGIFKGVKKKMAARIVDKFGTETLKIIGAEPEKLQKVDGIGKKTAARIAEDYRSHMEFADVVVFFANHGISSADATKMYSKYKTDTIKTVMENPYRLVSDIRGFGFKKADQTAARLGFDHDSMFRVQSGLKYVLGRYVADGSTCAPYRECSLRTAELLEISSEKVDEAADRLAMEQQVRLIDSGGGMAIYPTLYYNAESRVASRIIAMTERRVKPLGADTDGLILRSETDAGIRLSDRQRSAVETALESCICVITGGPGTGKTTIINTIIDVFEQCGINVALAAPTGRAAKRMSEASGRPAATIHRLLEYTFSEDEENMHFGRDHSNPLDQDAVIVDEMSMVDTLLMDALIDALPADARFIMVGDADQLPSVGAGRVLGDIIDSEIVQTVKLTRIFRQAEESMITVNAHRINKGEYPFLNEKDRDFFMISRQAETDILDTILDLCGRRLPSYYRDLHKVRDIQVLTPVRKGIVGTSNLNEKLQERLNPPAPGLSEKKIGGRIFREGDKVMQIRNNYDRSWISGDEEGTGVFNGDIGFVTDIDDDAGTLTVLYDSVRYAEYEFADVNELELAYAMTIHKSQGSEFQVVVMPVAHFPPMLANRNLLYTGITRARQGLVLVGSQRQLAGIIANNNTTRRYTGLCHSLRKALQVSE